MYSDYSLQVKKTLVILQVVASSVSLFASMTMAIFIALPTNGGMKTPSRRIMFCLLIADIFQSTALMTGPWSIPSWIELPWAHGNETTCKLNGVLMTTGQTSLPMYTCLMCFYYVCKLKYRITDEDFKRKEWKIHSFIVLYNIAIVWSALVFGVYNTTLHGSFCHFATIPFGCRLAENGDTCDSTIKNLADRYLLFNVLMLMTFSFIAITVMMVMLYKHALYMKNMSRTAYASNKNQSQTTNTTKVRSGDTKLVNQEGNLTQIGQIDDLPRFYERQMMMQAICYIGVYILTNMPVAVLLSIIMLSSYQMSRKMSVAAFFYAIGGLFNVLVYLRPKVVVFRTMHPEYSKLKSFWLVLSAGGEVPDIADGALGWCYFCQRAKSSSNVHINKEESIQNARRIPLRRGGPRIGCNKCVSSVPMISSDINYGFSEDEIEENSCSMHGKNLSNYGESEASLMKMESTQGDCRHKSHDDLPFPQEQAFESNNR